MLDGPGWWSQPAWVRNPTITPTWGQYSSGSSGPSAMRHSGVWAACRLRADLLSTLPLDVFLRSPDGLPVEIPTPAVLVKPGSQVRLMEWLYSSQMDLDRYGNSVGLITQRDGFGLPAQIEMWPMSDVVIRQKPGQDPTYRYRGAEYRRDQVWHERQYTVAGMAAGLSPVAYAAMVIMQYESAQQFALDWYGGAKMPSAVVRNTKRRLDPDEARIVKERIKASMRSGEPLVADLEWDFNPIKAAASDDAWLASMNASVTEIARFFGVPVDLIDGYSPVRGSITYANITQRNLQFLILNLGPMIRRREDAISADLLPTKRYAKFNTNALLQMDPASASTMLGQQVRDRLRAPSEVRHLWNLPPMTDEQIAEFARLGLTTSATQGVPA
jgi:HK97 family phage portal protein